MKSTYSHWAKSVAMLAVVGVVSSCGLPRSGPNKYEIYAGSVQKEGDAFIVAVDDRVSRVTQVTPSLGFSDSFKNAAMLGSDTIRPGDTLSLTVWENVDRPLLGPEGQVVALLDSIQVDGTGHIFVPYAGRIHAADQSPEDLRRVISQKLEDQTPDPQVEVRRTAGDGATVSLVGAIGGQGVYPIERPTRILSSMLAQAGGVAIEPEVAQVTVIRGQEKGTVWFQDIFKDPELDIALRGGDRILVEEDTRSFTALGATGSQVRADFESHELSALEAIAQVGGLGSPTADPTAVFVFRNETAATANKVLKRTNLKGAQRLVYVLNLTEPNGLFLARDFAIRNEDTIYVTEAPIVTWNKTISSLVGSIVSPASSLSSASGS